MRFHADKYMRHKTNTKTFFCISAAERRKGGTVILYGCWCEQGDGFWWFLHTDRVIIPPKEWPDWYKYSPRGSPLI